MRAAHPLVNESRAGSRCLEVANGSPTFPDFRKGIEFARAGLGIATRGYASAGSAVITKGPIGCSRASTVAVTIIAGPLNYTGVDPKINCTVQHPSN
jgi:hypothetical protein